MAMGAAVALCRCHRARRKLSATKLRKQSSQLGWALLRHATQEIVSPVTGRHVSLGKLALAEGERSKSLSKLTCVCQI